MQIDTSKASADHTRMAAAQIGDSSTSTVHATHHVHRPAHGFLNQGISSGAMHFGRPKYPFASRDGR
jgi:hypothetical protein